MPSGDHPPGIDTTSATKVVSTQLEQVIEFERLFWERFQTARQCAWPVLWDGAQTEQEKAVVSDTADDVAQEALWALWTDGPVGWMEWREPRVRAWLRTTARNKAHDQRRRSHPTDSLSEHEHDERVTGADFTDRLAESDELRERIDACFDRLSPTLRECLTLRQVDGLEYEQIGARLKLKTSTVKIYLSKACYQFTREFERLNALPAHSCDKNDDYGGRPNNHTYTQEGQGDPHD